MPKPLDAMVAVVVGCRRIFGGAAGVRNEEKKSRQNCGA
jgi:hypothetical protein